MRLPWEDIPSNERMDAGNFPIPKMLLATDAFR